MLPLCRGHAAKQRYIAMRYTLPLILVLLGACAPQSGPATSGKARFAQYPTGLFEALESACEGDAQTFLRIGRERVECREYLPPEQTAAIILAHDGTPTDLPQLVIRFDTRADGPGWLVENDVFLSVPQKSGKALELRDSNPQLDQTLNALYQRAGGAPE